MGQFPEHEAHTVMTESLLTVSFPSMFLSLSSLHNLYPSSLSLSLSHSHSLCLSLSLSLSLIRLHTRSQILHPRPVAQFLSTFCTSAVISRGELPVKCFINACHLALTKRLQMMACKKLFSHHSNSTHPPFNQCGMVELIFGWASKKY